MRKEAKHLFQKAIDSLTISIELFNRPNDSGRTHGVLIFMDHAFEMLLKASIIERHGKIFEKGKSETIGMSACIRKCLTDSRIRFLIEEEVLVLQSINSLRDAAQHYTLIISEQQLYFQAQAGLTLFRDIVKTVFAIDLRTHLPERVLPISTIPPMEINAFFQSEIYEIKKLLTPNSRKMIEAKDRLRALAIFENSLQGNDGQPAEKDLITILHKIKDDESYESIFPSVSILKFTANGYGPSLDLRITKDKDSTPINLVPEGTPGATIVSVKRVNELGYYTLSLTDLSSRVDLSTPKLLAVIKELKIQDNPDYYKCFKIKTSIHKMYSPAALNKLKIEIPILDIEDIWQRNRPVLKKKNK